MSRTVRSTLCALVVFAGGMSGSVAFATTEPPADTAPSATGPSSASDASDPAGGAAACSTGTIAGSTEDGSIARCAPGHPAPRPLAEPADLVVSSAFTAEFIAPLLLAQHYGEFERENVSIEIVNLPFPDAVPQLVTGEVDVAVGGTDAALMNSASEGLGVMWAMGNFFPSTAGDLSTPQTGLWVRRDYFSDPQNPDIAELQGATIASAVGIGNATSYFIEAALQTGGLTVTDLNWEVMPSADMVTALDNGAVDLAWLLDPYWLEVADRPDEYVLIGTQTYGESIGGYYFGPDAFGDNRPAAEAFTRAMIRTINTYLDGDYHADAEVMSALSESIGQPAEAMAQVPSLVFDWEVHEGVGDGIQEVLRTAGVLGFEGEVPEDEYIDRSLYDAVIAEAAND